MHERSTWAPIEVVNVVVTASCGQTLDLDRLSTRLENAEYFPKKFAALKVCRASPFASALVFRTGKIVCVGAPSIASASSAADWFVQQILVALDLPSIVPEIIVRNITAHTKLVRADQCIAVTQMESLVPNLVQYEAELFPGCTFRPGMARYVQDVNAYERVILKRIEPIITRFTFAENKAGPVVNCFHSGKAVITGVKTYAEVSSLFHAFHETFSPKYSLLLGDSSIGDSSIETMTRAREEEPQKRLRS